MIDRLHELALSFILPDASALLFPAAASSFPGLSVEPCILDVAQALELSSGGLQRGPWLQLSLLLPLVAIVSLP